MSNTKLASYSFLPWVRQGLGNEILEDDFLGGPIPGNAALERPEIIVSVKVEAAKAGANQTHTIPKTVKVQGPGDVLGISSKSIIRVHPKKGVTNFETNNLCYVEFYEEDLPWRFTPAKPKNGKLRPWLALIVLRRDEFEFSAGGTPTPYISISNDALANVFCNEADTYALAHVHVLEDLGESSSSAAEQLAAKLAKNPDLALSRILCPRKLEYRSPNPSLEFDPNEYQAFLIPAFETGRLAGLGEATAAIPAQKSSWSRIAIQNGSNPTNYPYYHTWSFKVDAGGDFESLAQLLEARELPDNIGKRDMVLGDMGFGIKPMGNDEMGFVEGAMRHPDYQTAPWPSDANLKNQLLRVLNLSFELQDEKPLQNTSFFYTPTVDFDPIVTPPIYGKWHKGIDKLSGNHTDGWIGQVNLHPSHRAAAGLGVQVVQKHQEKFMEMAWEQIGEINEANQKIRESELAKRASKALAVKKVFKLGEFDMINATGKAFEMMRMDGVGTIKKELKNSTVPTAIRSGTFLKVANNFTPTALMNGGKDGAFEVLNPALFDKLNRVDGAVGKISASPRKVEPKIVLPTLVAFSAIQSVLNDPPISFMEHLATAILATQMNDFKSSDVIAKLPQEFTEAQRVRAKAILDGITKREMSGNPKVLTIKESVFNDRISDQFQEGYYGPQDQVKFVKEVAASEIVYHFKQSDMTKDRLLYKTSFEEKFITKSDSANFVKLFKKPIRAVLKQDFSQKIMTRLNPMINFDRKLASFFIGNFKNIDKPIMAYPRFPIPVYNYLKEISPDYIIPNISEIEPNTITLMETNREFIESFLVGMNHEFSRELLWREFPTDMRGSYFRHFWDYDNDPNKEPGPDESYEKYVEAMLEKQDAGVDIKEIHKWTGPLGRNDAKGGFDLVLLIKGDLLRKYPNTLVYAQKANYTNGNPAIERSLSELEKDIRWPIITGSLEPDVYFFGFDLSKEEVNGNRTNNPGWFFVLRERPGQISFGLDDLKGNTLPPVQNWNQVTWAHVSGNPQVKPPYLKVNGPGLPITLSSSGTGPRAAQWGANSSDMAYILHQSPILFARHASTMLTD